MVPVSENGDTIQPNTHIDANNKQKINPVNNYTTIDTQYGKLHIENETLKRLGNDKIMEKFTEFKKLQNMARKDENLSGKDSYSTISYFNYSTNTLNAVPASGISPLSMIWNLERTYFNDSSANANRPTLIWGHVEVQPISSGSTQHWDGAYLEREIMLNNYDCIEFIVQYNGYPANTANLGFCIYDNCMHPGDTLVPYSPPVHANNIVHTSYDYELSINVDSYDMWWSDFITGDYWVYNYPDSTMSNYIYRYYGSAELNCDSIQSNFRMQTDIKDCYIRIGSYYYYIGDYFTTLDNSETNKLDGAYVYSNSWYDVYKFTHSRLIIANPDPT
ncbi:MAG: hypothetical protein WBZ29_05205 [Methanocella sp.]